MDTENLEYLNQQIKLYERESLDEIKDGIMALWQQSILEQVYNVYNPTEYQRTYDLMNKFDMYFDDNKLVIKTATDDYQSAVDDHDVSNLVPNWIGETGHTDNKGSGMYHNYQPPRHFLEKVKQMIEDEYGLQVKIIENI